MLSINSDVVTALKILRATAILEKWRSKTVLRLYLANRKSHVKNANTKFIVRLFLYNNASVIFSHKRIILDAILKKMTE